MTALHAESTGRCGFHYDVLNAITTQCINVTDVPHIPQISALPTLDRGAGYTLAGLISLDDHDRILKIEGLGWDNKKCNLD